MRLADRNIAKILMISVLILGFNVKICAQGIGAYVNVGTDETAKTQP